MCPRFLKVSLKDFNDKIMKGILEKMMVPVENILSKTKLNPGEISEVLLVGGSTRIKCVKNKLEERFSKGKIV